MAVASVLVTLVACELGLRAMKPKPRPRAPPPVLACGDCPYLFALNPAHPGISPQGLRDRVFSPAPPAGTFRILVLGDSVSYGTQTSAEIAFPKQLERELGERYGRVEVINASVPAYSPYNEWQYYVHRVRAFHPHLVLVSFCMNDVVDPSLHWATLVTTGVGRSVPDAAVPNMRHHREYALPELERRSMKNQGRLRRALLRTEIYARLDAYLRTLAPLPHVDVGGRSFRSFLSGEDTTSMEVLADGGSPEWAWLRGIYDQLIAAVRADGAAVAIVVNPLEYQLDPDYPIDPSPAFARYCAERKIPCFDLVPGHARSPRRAPLRRPPRRDHRHLALRPRRPPRRGARARGHDPRDRAFSLRRARLPRPDRDTGRETARAQGKKKSAGSLRPLRPCGPSGSAIALADSARRRP